MKEINYEEVNTFLKKLPLQNFPLVQHYLDYDACYTNNSWVTYTIFWEDEKPIAVVGERKPFNDPRHLLVFEVNTDYINKGYGKKCLMKYMEKSPNWELMSLETAEGFYRKLGFKEDHDMLIFGDKR